MGKKRTIILSTLFCIISILIGFFIGNGLINKDISENFNNRLHENSFLNYYSGNHYEKRERLIEFLNNNPVDEEYLKKLTESKTPGDESIIIGEWIDRYDKELDIIYNEIEAYINSIDFDNEHMDKESVLSDLENMKTISSKYLSIKGSSFENIKMLTSGYGTEFSSYLSIFELNSKRNMLFEMIELMYGWSDSISFISPMKE